MADGDSVHEAQIQKRALFEAYDAAKADIAIAAKVLQEATKDIVEACGHGPFLWKGQEITIAKRGEGFVTRVKSRKAEEIV